jgi:hypothetical protein
VSSSFSVLHPKQREERGMMDQGWLNGPEGVRKRGLTTSLDSKDRSDLVKSEKMSF